MRAEAEANSTRFRAYTSEQAAQSPEIVAPLSEACNDSKEDVAPLEHRRHPYHLPQIMGECPLPNLRLRTSVPLVQVSAYLSCL